MGKRVTVVMDDDAAELLVQLAGSSRKQGQFLSELVRAAEAAKVVTVHVTGSELESLRQTLQGLALEVMRLKARSDPPMPLAPGALPAGRLERT